MIRVSLETLKQARLGRAQKLYYWVAQAFFFNTGRQKTKTQVKDNCYGQEKLKDKHSILNLCLWKLKFFKGVCLIFYAIFNAKYFQNQYIIIEN